MKLDSTLLLAPAVALSLSTVPTALPDCVAATERVSVTSAGVEATFRSNYPAISGDGSVVAFESSADDLIPGDTNFSRDIFVHDRGTGTTTRVSVSSAGAQSNHHSYNPSLSADGRHVVFHSKASNLVVGDTNGFDDAFLHDRLTGVTTRVSVGAGGVQPNGHCYDVVVTTNGSKVAFVSSASNLVAGDTNNVIDVFVRDLAAGTNTRASVSSAGVQGDSNSFDVAFSSDGQVVAFSSLAANLVLLDTNGQQDIFVRDLVFSQTTRVSLSTAGVQGNSFSRIPEISADGRYVTFESLANTLVASDLNVAEDVFLHDRVTAETSIVSVDSGGVHGNSISVEPSISADGRRIAFYSWSSNLVTGDLNSKIDVFVHDTTTQLTQRMSVDSAGLETNGHSFDPAISGDGRFVAFHSEGDTLVPGDTNGYGDIFVHDSMVPAGIASRNAGANPMSFTANLPILGSSWSANVDLTTTGHGFALVIGTVAPVEFTLGGGQVLLIAGAQVFTLPIKPGPVASWILAIPSDPSLAGLNVYTQAAHVGVVLPFALSNAQDLCLGY